MDTHSSPALTQALHDTFRAGKPYGHAAVGTLFERARPEPGNARLFETHDISCRGHPGPLACPQGLFRRPRALYDHTRARPDEGSVFRRTEMTGFIERPGETSHSNRPRRVRQRLQLRTRRLAHGLFRGRKP
ncbi:MAG TPA: hypothetical protein VF292_10725 [Rhodanobacteraceae bacterium]